MFDEFLLDRDANDLAELVGLVAIALNIRSAGVYVHHDVGAPHSKAVVRHDTAAATGNKQLGAAFADDVGRAGTYRAPGGSSWKYLRQ